jgi:hypothetical protein
MTSDETFHDEYRRLFAMHTDACNAAGVEPLPEDDLAVIANAVLSGRLPVAVTLQ